MSVSKTMYLPWATGHNNKGNPLVGVEYSLLIFLISKGTKQIHC